MIPTLVRLAVRRSLNDTHYVQVVKPRHAAGLVADVYRQVEHDFGMLAPPTALHSPSPETLAACWLILRETLLAEGFAERSGKEAVAPASRCANNCPYCEDVHGMTLDALAGGADGDALTEWAKGSATAAGAGPVPGPPEQAPELIGVALAFQYYNRVANVFLADSPFPAHVPLSARSKARRVLGARAAPLGRRRGPAGRLARPAAAGAGAGRPGTGPGPTRSSPTPSPGPTRRSTRPASGPCPRASATGDRATVHLGR